VTEMLEHTHKNTCCLCCRQLLASRRPLHPSGRTATIERSLSSGSSPSTSPSTSCTFAARSPSTALARAQRRTLAAARPCKSTGDASARVELVVRASGPVRGVCPCARGRGARGRRHKYGIAALVIFFSKSTHTLVRPAPRDPALLPSAGPSPPIVSL